VNDGRVWSERYTGLAISSGRAADAGCCSPICSRSWATPVRT
jgi:hypothetical protein